MSLPEGIAIDAEVDLGLTQGVHHLAARLNVRLPGMEREVAESIVEMATHVCPYSLATQGNIETTYNVITTDTADATAELQHA